MMHLGDFPVNGVVSFLWNTNAVAGESITRATDGAIRIYKTHATRSTWETQRTSSSGISDFEDFDSQTGVHACRIDLSDNTDDGFYAAGNEYQVVLSGATIDGKAINAVLAHFSIERANGVLALLKDGTNGLAAIKGFVDDLESRLTATRAGYLDHLAGGAVALASGVTVSSIAANAVDATALAANAVDKIWGKTMTELSAVPGVTASMLSAVSWIFTLARNRIEQTATLQTVRKDDQTTALATATVSDDGVTAVRGEWT